MSVRKVLVVDDSATDLKKLEQISRQLLTRMKALRGVVVDATPVRPEGLVVGEAEKTEAFRG